MTTKESTSTWAHRKSTSTQKTDQGASCSIFRHLLPLRVRSTYQRRKPDEELLSYFNDEMGEAIGFR